MKVSKAALCTLAALAAQDLSRQAIASPTPLSDEDRGADTLAQLPEEVLDTATVSDVEVWSDVPLQNSSEMGVASNDAPLETLEDTADENAFVPDENASVSGEVYPEPIVVAEFSTTELPSIEFSHSPMPTSLSEAVSDLPVTTDIELNDSPILALSSVSQLDAAESEVDATVTDVAPLFQPPSAIIVAQTIEFSRISQTLPRLTPATSFGTVQGHWAQPFMERLIAADIIEGFEEDGTVRPDAPMTRAQYAALLDQAFAEPSVRSAASFVDVPASHWANAAIQSSYRMGFLESQSGQRFLPDQPITRTAAIAALVKGLNLTADTLTPADLSTYFEDADAIPINDRGAIAAAIEHHLIVNHPDVAMFNPNQVATRAEVMAFVHQALAAMGDIAAIPASSSASQWIVGERAIAQAPDRGNLPNNPVPAIPDPALHNSQQEQLENLENLANRPDGDRSAPALTIVNPSGFGVDNGTFFLSGTFQSETRYSNTSDGAIGFGVGLGDAREAVGLELSYTVASFGGSRDFGTGGFNLKLHRQFSDTFAGAVGWNGFITTGDVDFEDSAYAVLTKIFELSEDINDPFSRIAFTVGFGGGQFRTEDDVEDGDPNVNVFGSMAIRIAEPVSLITEWSGQDLGIGLSIAPFRDVNLTITPAVRDITGAGDEARFVLGAGITF
jgi:hypothetical protein